MLVRSAAAVLLATASFVGIARADVLCELSGAVKIIHGTATCPDGYTKVNPNQFLTPPAGNKGARGKRGPQGIQGPAGPAVPGAKGYTGKMGDRGPQGPAGDKGGTGAVGPEGYKGPKGDAGPVGDTGPQGDKGDPGSGPQGERGPAGGTGPAGPIGDSGIIGEIGLKGDNLKFENMAAQCKRVNASGVLNESPPWLLTSLLTFKTHLCDTGNNHRYFLMTHTLNTKATIGTEIGWPITPPVVSFVSNSAGPDEGVNIVFTRTRTTGGWETITYDYELICCLLNTEY